MYLFPSIIRDLDGWAEIFQNRDAFAPLVRHILSLHHLPQTEIVNTTPGSHAVFRAGEILVKVYAPDCVGWECESDFQTELAAMRFANRRGVCVPELIAHGRVRDRYEFRYILQRFVEGTEFGKARLSDTEKEKVGRQLRVICDRMNVPCERFNDYNFVEDALADGEEWEGFAESFLRSREDYLRTRPHGEVVYVHGDIHIDNAILDDAGQIWILDFADSVLAPVEYEYASLIPGLFRMERAYLDGFFGEWDAEEVAERLTYGFCIHRFGGHIVADILPEEGKDLRDVADLQERLTAMLQK